ncbi:cell division protein FtsL [Acidisoma sp.]|uniref:cell division protein FtsL n=1 Tax=Acidisoma sp. TaxID=1872115 RepID=UPI003B0035E2
MIRPFTCVCLILAAGSGLYLYQVKQRAFALDASLRSTFHDIDAARDRTRMLRADWALVNDPERLQALASQYLKLQPMQPSQLLTMDQLAAALPPPVPASTTTAPAASKPAPLAVPALSIPDPTHGVPMAAAIPPVLPHAHPATPEVALLQPVAPQPAAPQPAAPRPAAPAAVAPPVSAASLPAPMAPPKPLHHGARHLVPQAQPWLANGNGFPPPPHRHADHHASPEVAARQFYAANLPSREDVAARITPQAATVMYRPAASGSSLGMASSAALAPPRPLYPNSQ